MKKFIFLVATANFLLAAPSAFEAGNLNSNNPYGLTKDEKYIWQNKQDIKQLKDIVKQQQITIKQQNKDLSKLKLQFLNYKMQLTNFSQQLEGVKSVLPNIGNITNSISSLKSDLNSTNSIMFALKDEVNNLKNTINQNKKINDNNTNTIISLVEKLATKIDKLKKDINKVNTKKNKDFTNLSKAQILNKAIYNFKHSHYAMAQKMFKYLVNQNYKVATSLFYLGEIEYKFARYKVALGFYKKSIQAYSKPTKFTPTLLYHTGYSFERIGNKEAAKQSFLKLIHDFPNSIFVKYSKKRIQNLEK